MALSKTSVLLCISMIVYFALVADVADAKFISYGALQGDGRVCTQPAGCTEPDIPANPYDRGCQVSQRCRGVPGSPGKPKEN
ncbi:hypothetical protein AgCh_037752 [Apium graveolens]